MSGRSFVHGTNKGYEAGCRCDKCSAYQRKRVARNRAARLADGRLTHGLRSAWDAGCRCDECRAAHQAAHADYRERIRPPSVALGARSAGPD